MGTLSNPKTLVPDMNTKDCSQGFCTLYCPQWCYLMFPPPPPPFAFPQPERDSSSFSPLVIAIIGILASAFLLLSYYVIISKYCSRCMTQDQGQNHYFSEEFDEDHEDPSNYEEQWGVSNDGLDDFLIKSITICKYKKGDGLVDFNDCPVCLGEFEENDALRLLPKCNHAFHVSCIDTWLKSNSNCPLCRANIVSNSTLSHPSSASPRDLGSSQQTPNENDQVWNAQIGNETECPEGIPKSPVRGLRDTVIENDQLWTTQTSTETEDSESIPQSPAQGLRDTIIEISDDNENMVRRSFSMDHPRGNNISIGDTSNGASSSRSRVLHSVMKSISMKRSLSSGRLFFIKDGRARNAVIPV